MSAGGAPVPRSLAAPDGPPRGGLGDERDEELARRAAGGDAEALESLLRAHQDWVYTVALRMLGDRATAADCAQDALVRVVTRIAQFEGRSSFRTWAYRIVFHTILDETRARKRAGRDFEAFRRELDSLPSRGWTAPDAALLHEETRMRCMTGMLLCLDAEQRMAYLLSDMLDVPAPLAAEVLGISHAALRKRVERARRDLGRFVLDQCGLVRPENPCRCANKTRALLERGLVDPERLVFARRGWQQADSARPRLVDGLDAAATALRALMQDQPIAEGPDIATKLQSILASAGLPGGIGDDR